MIGQTLAGRYHILKELGKGAFGHTYLAEDTQLPNNKRCVVKHLKPQATDEFTLKIAKKLFNREAELLNKLGEQNPQIPTLLAHFEENQQFYLVQELIDGHDLSQEILPGKKLPESEVIAILDQVLDILVFVHQQHAIHRDIKPSNIMRRSKDQKLVLIDFGAVKELTTQIVNSEGGTGLTVTIGTPGYMPSEQSQSRPKFASDIYSLGILAIFALTGIKPHKIRRNSQTEEIIWRDENQVSDELGDVIDKMVRYNFQERYLSAIEAKADLQKIIAPPTSILKTSAAPPLKSEFSLVKTIAVTTALVCTLGAGGYYFWQRNSSVLPLTLTYESLDHGIQMAYPNDWDLEKTEDFFGPIARFSPRNNQGESTPVLVTIEVQDITDDTSLDEYTTSTIADILKYLPEAKIISSQPITLGTKSAHQVIYTGKNRGQDFFSKYLRVWLVDSKHVYDITYNAAKDKYPGFIETVEKTMIPSLAIGEELP
ncbi:serine/threonine protein kinase [Xenococcus sp. PCC 7305]|uniref:serine/threonine-protein kinase n=1 Tax=Xenococcus sp. PCC 7305 TaxID=102125 RepID=UPI0002AB9D44|nr:serine/threonine-protein kinase [Xenococcus sp. PCC 7305]ELS04056.1 serine/threonine protein kinase [Xenococcus sp. PCC 7305]